MKKAANKKRRVSRVRRTPKEYDILPEYDFSVARRNPYATRFRERVVVVMLDPDVAANFPDAAAVNDALRALAKIAHRQPKRPGSKLRTA